MQTLHAGGGTKTVDLPALPARGRSVTFEVASRTTAGAHYTASLGVTASGTVVIDCGCPARRARCWHVETVERVLVARGDAHVVFGMLTTTEPALALVPDLSDPFAGLV